jgi:hypothetical protein
MTDPWTNLTLKYRIGDGTTRKPIPEPKHDTVTEPRGPAQPSKQNPFNPKWPKRPKRPKPKPLVMPLPHRFLRMLADLERRVNDFERRVLARKRQP